MQWSFGHILIIAAVLLAGLIIGAKNPALAQTATLGLVKTG